MLRRHFRLAIPCICILAGALFFGWLPRPAATQSATVPPPLAIQLPAANRGENHLRPAAPPSLRLLGERLSPTECTALAHQLPSFTAEGLAIAPNQIGANRSVQEDWLAQPRRLGDVRARTGGDMLTGYAAALTSPRAAALRLHFEGVDLPPGAELYVYGAADNVVSGPYTGKGPFGSGEFWTDVLAGDTAVVEWLEPAGKMTSFRVTEVAHIWDSPLPPTVKATGKVAGNGTEVGDCHLDAMCGPEVEKDAIARIVFQTSGGTSVCSGTALNTRINDWTPLLLTANHCISTAAEAQSVQAFWFYRTTACNSGVVSSNFFRSPTGATLLQTNAPSDHTLLEILGVIPRNLYYSGWEPNPRQAGTNVFALHHPGIGTPVSQSQLSFLRRSLGTIAGLSTGCLQGGYRVNWNQGVTEPGSSGSGIWYSPGGAGPFLVGVLSCGPAACGVPPNQLFDNYGRFSDFFPSIRNLLDNGGPDDPFEPNDSRAGARLVTPPVNANNLVVKEVSEDWYAIQVTTGARILATVNFTHNFGDIDLELYRDQETQPVATSRSTSNSETIDFTNTGPASRFFLRVFLFNDTRNTYQMSLNVTGGAPPPPPSTVGCFRPSDGFVYQRFTNTPGFADNSFFYGQAGDRPIAGDWNGDGIDTVGIFRNGVFFLKNSNTPGFADLSFAYGGAGDIPLAGDWDGDGVDTIGVYRNGTFFLRNSNSAGSPDIVVNYGNPNDLPIVGDWDGNRTTTVGCFRSSNGFFYIRNSNTPGFADSDFFYGQAGDIPVVGDWNGDGVDTIGIYRRGTFFLRNANSAGFADIQVNYGSPGDIPIVGRWR